MLPAIFFGRAAVGLCKFLIEEAHVLVPYGVGDVRHAHIAHEQEIGSRLHALLQDQLLVGAAGLLLEKGGQIVWIQVEESCGILQGTGGIIAFNVVEDGDDGIPLPALFRVIRHILLKDVDQFGDDQDDEALQNVRGAHGGIQGLTEEFVHEQRDSAAVFGVKDQEMVYIRVIVDGVDEEAGDRTLGGESVEKALREILSADENIDKDVILAGVAQSVRRHGIDQTDLVRLQHMLFVSDGLLAATGIHIIEFDPVVGVRRDLLKTGVFPDTEVVLWILGFQEITLFTLDDLLRKDVKIKRMSGEISFFAAGMASQMVFQCLWSHVSSLSGSFFARSEWLFNVNEDEAILYITKESAII